MSRSTPELLREALVHLDLACEYAGGEDLDQLMWGMRNRIAHGYLLVDSDIVSRTIEIDLPDVVREVRRELSDA